MPDVFSPPPAEPVAQRSLAYRLALARDILFGRFPSVPASAQTTPAPKADPEPASNKTQDDTPTRGLPDANYVQTQIQTWRELFYGNTARNARYAAYEQMDTGQIAAMLDAVVDSCLVSDDGQLVGFKVKAKGAKLQSIIDNVNKNLNLTFDIRFILRDLLKFGDVFLMPVIDKYGNVVDYESPPAGQMFKFVDTHMRLLAGTEEVVIGNQRVKVPRAYQQKTDALQTVAGWYSWECFHLRWFPSKNLIYSKKSFLEDIRNDETKLRLTEEALLWHRITRSSPRNQHTLDLTGKSQDEAEKAIANYVNELRTEKTADGSRQEHIMSVKEDFVISSAYRQGSDGKLYPSLNNMKLLDPRNTSLTALPDIEHLERKIFSRVPSELVGILPDRNDITSQDIAAARLYAYCQFIIVEQFLRPLYNLALTLRGFVPERDDYEIVFPNIQMRASWRSADARFRDSMASANEIEQGIVSRKRVAMNRYSFTEDEWEKEKEEIKKEQKEFMPLQQQASGVGTKTGTGAKAAKTTQVRKGQNST